MSTYQEIVDSYNSKTKSLLETPLEKIDQKQIDDYFTEFSSFLSVRGHGHKLPKNIVYAQKTIPGALALIEYFFKRSHPYINKEITLSIPLANDNKESKKEKEENNDVENNVEPPTKKLKTEKKETEETKKIQDHNNIFLKVYGMDDALENFMQDYGGEHINNYFEKNALKSSDEVIRNLFAKYPEVVQEVGQNFFKTYLEKTKTDADWKGNTEFYEIEIFTFNEHIDTNFISFTNEIMNEGFVGNLHFVPVYVNQN